MSSGCARATVLPPQHCLECAKGFHLYGGRCYTHCPEGSYPTEVSIQKASRRRNFTYVERQTSEADDMEPHLCLLCHYSCATCDGPEDYQCLSCPKDAILMNTTDGANKFYCYPSSVVSQFKKSDRLYQLNFVIAIFISVITLIYVLIYCIRKLFSDLNKLNKPNVAYNKLAMDDNQQRAIEVEQEIHDAILGVSDSDSEDESNVKS